MANENRIEIWGSRFKEIRVALNMSQTALGKEIGLSGQYIGAIERKDIANISKEVFNTFVNEYNINPEYLQGYETNSNLMFINIPAEDVPEESTTDVDETVEEKAEETVDESEASKESSILTGEICSSVPVELMDVEDINHAVNSLISVLGVVKDRMVYINNDEIKNIVTELNEMSDEQLEFVKAFMEFMKSQS